MNVLSTGLAAAIALSLLSTACVSDDGDQDAVAGPDAAFATFDAQPLPVVPDAAIPQPDAKPGPDAGASVGLACSLEDATPIVECVSENCVDALADGSLPECVASSCGLILLTTSPECTDCIIAAIADTSLALDACLLGLDDFDGSGSPVP